MERFYLRLYIVLWFIWLCVTPLPGQVKGIKPKRKMIEPIIKPLSYAYLEVYTFYRREIGELLSSCNVLQDEVTIRGP